MKARLTVCGIDQGTIEIGDDSLVGQLGCGDFGDLAAWAKRFEEDMCRLTAVEAASVEVGDANKEC